MAEDNTADLLEALKQSEHRYRNIFQAMSVAFWELDFFPVGDLLRGVRKQGVEDFGAYFRQNPDFVTQMMRATGIVDVNDRTVALQGAGDKARLLAATLDQFWPEASRGVYALAVIAAVTGKTSYSAETRLAPSTAGSSTPCSPPASRRTP